MPNISPRTQRRVSLLVSLVSLAAVAWWISQQDTPQFPDSPKGWAWLLAAVGAYGVALAVRGFRWHRILRLIHIPHKRADAYRLMLVGYMGNNVLPLRGGEILRIGLLSSRSTARRREILSSVIAERLLDAAVLAALFAILTWFNVADAPAGETPAAIAAVALVLAAIALAAYLALRRRGRFHAFHAKVGPFLKALKLFAHVEGVLLAALTVFAWCCEGLTLMLVGRSLGLGLHLLDTLSIIVLASLFAAIPAAPGYAGTFDAGLVLGLKSVGVTGGVAVGFVLLARFVMFVPVTVVGLFLLLHTYGGFRRESEILRDAQCFPMEDPPPERERDADDAGRDKEALGAPGSGWSASAAARARRSPSRS
jgi:uncharacterized protein (TIRG00374 family)